MNGCQTSRQQQDERVNDYLAAVERRRKKILILVGCGVFVLTCYLPAIFVACLATGITAFFWVGVPLAIACAFAAVPFLSASKRQELSMGDDLVALDDIRLLPAIIDSSTQLLRGGPRTGRAYRDKLTDALVYYLDKAGPAQSCLLLPRHISFLRSVLIKEARQNIRCGEKTVRNQRLIIAVLRALARTRHVETASDIAILLGGSSAPRTRGLDFLIASRGAGLERGPLNLPEAVLAAAEESLRTLSTGDERSHQLLRPAERSDEVETLVIPAVARPSDPRISQSHSVDTVTGEDQLEADTHSCSG